MLKNMLQTAVIYCKIILILTGSKDMCCWNSGQIAPTNQLMEYLTFRKPRKAAVMMRMSIT